MDALDVALIVAPALIRVRQVLSDAAYALTGAQVSHAVDAAGGLTHTVSTQTCSAAA